MIGPTAYTAQPPFVLFLPVKRYIRDWALQPVPPSADMEQVKLRTPTLDLIVTEYANAVASGEFERAEGWLAVAEFAAVRQADRTRGARARSPRPLAVTRERSPIRAG